MSSEQTERDLMLLHHISVLTKERDEAIRVRDLAREASQRDLEAKRAAEAQLSETVEALRQIQWGSLSFDQDGHAYDLCPMCDQSEVRGHSPDCRVGAALEKAGK